MMIKFPMSIKLLSVILSIVILAASLLLSVIAFNDENGDPDKVESGYLQGNKNSDTGLQPFDIPEVVPLSELENHSIVDRMRNEEQSLCDIVFANDDGSRTSFLYGTPVKYVFPDGLVRDKSFYIADLSAEPENGYVGRMESDLADSVKSLLFSSLKKSFDGNITEADIRYATLDNDVHTLYGETSDTGIIVGRNEYFIRMIPSGDTNEVFLSESYSLSDGEEKERISYPNVFGEGTILQYSPTLNGLKEDIILERPTDQTTFSFLVETTGLELIEEKGTIQFQDTQTGKIVGKLGEILVMDSKGYLSRGTISVTDVAEENGHLILMMVDPEFLTEASYPVFIDPTVYLYPNGTDYLYGNYTFIEDVSIYDDIEAQGYTFIEWHQIGDVLSTGYYGQAAFRFPALYDTTQPNGYSNLTPEQIGSFKLHLKSTSSTNSTNVLRASTYVPTWPNTFKIFSSSYFNYFSMTSNDVTVNNVPVNNTFEIDLTGMARYWKNIQYGLELGNYGTPDSGVLLWNYGNTGTIWLESVEYSSSIYAVLDYSSLPSGSVYLNNKESGEFLGYFAGSLEHISGLVENIGEEIGWIIESVGIDVYTIKENTPGGQYLSYQVLYGSTLGPVLSDTPTNWNISIVSGGGCSIQLAGFSDKYLAIDGNSLALNYYLPDNQKCWRIVSGSAYSGRELRSIEAADLTINYAGLAFPSLTTTSSGSLTALWADSSDFTYSISAGSQYVAYNAFENSFSSISTGIATVTVTHKVTSVTDSFQISTNCEKAIIILPGIMGSAIYSRGFSITYNNTLYSYDNDDILWDPLDYMPYNDFPTNASIFDHVRASIIALSYDSVGAKLFPSSEDPPIINDNRYPYRKYGALDIYKNVYLRLCDEYSDEYDVILYEYDWRKDPYVIATELDIFIQSHHYGQIVFVSHSMGGNVSSYYLSLGADQRSRVYKHISVGTPFLGSGKIAYVYDTGDAIDIPGIDTIVDSIMNSEIKTVCPNFSSIYSLLPPNDSFLPFLKIEDETGNSTTITSFNSTMTLLPIYLDNWNSSLCNSAIAHQAALFENGQHVSKLVDSYYIVGDGCETPEYLKIKINANEEKVGNISIDSTSYNGDGTVSVHSSLIGGTISNHVLFKYDSATVLANHLGLIEGKDDQKTFDYICDVIDGVDVDSYNDTIFFSKYSGYKERQ